MLLRTQCSGKRFISVYRLGIVAEPVRVIVYEAKNICELVYKDSSTSEALRDYFASYTINGS